MDIQFVYAAIVGFIGGFVAMRALGGKCCKCEVVGEECVHTCCQEKTCCECCSCSTCKN